jgi:hypothetical protein
MLVGQVLGRFFLAVLSLGKIYFFSNVIITLGVLRYSQYCILKNIGKLGSDLKVLSLLSGF